MVHLSMALIQQRKYYIKECRTSPEQRSHYHEKVMRAGFKTIGRSMWLVVTVAMGNIATKSLICQSGGMNVPQASTIMPIMPMRANAMENLNFLRTLGTSMKKFENSASLEVAPQVMSISNI